MLPQGMDARVVWLGAAPGNEKRAINLLAQGAMQIIERFLAA
jgi:hypothetical protein